MARTFIGNKPGYGPVVKVLRNDGDDPLTTANNQYGKFLFNSENTELAYIARIYPFQRGWVDFVYPNPGGTYYWPVGTDLSNCWAVVKVTGGSSAKRWMFYFFLDRMFGWPAIPGFAAAVEYRFLKSSKGAGWIDGPRVNFAAHSEPGYAQQSGLWSGAGLAQGTSYPAGQYLAVLGFNAPGPCAIVDYNDAVSGGADMVVSFWDLPANDAPIPYSGNAPISGQRSLLMNPAAAKMAKPGYEVGTASRAQCIFDSTRVPAKVIGGGDVYVSPRGYAVLQLKATPNNTTYLDFHVVPDFYGVDLMIHPPLLRAGFNKDAAANFYYGFAGQQLVLWNDNDFGIRIRGIVFSDDASDPTSGGTAVVRRGNDGVQDYFQIKRPGSSDYAPNLNDIILDTRLPYLPIVKEGFIFNPNFTDNPYPNATYPKLFGERGKIVYFDQDGSFLPFVKHFTVYWSGTHAYGSSPKTGVHWSQALPETAPYGNHQTGDGMPVAVGTNWAWFNTANGNPTSLWWERNWQTNAITSGATWGDAAYPLGVRYYIFGIPKTI